LESLSRRRKKEWRVKENRPKESPDHCSLIKTGAKGGEERRKKKRKRGGDHQPSPPETPLLSSRTAIAPQGYGKEKEEKRRSEKGPDPQHDLSHLAESPNPYASSYRCSYRRNKRKRKGRKKKKKEGKGCHS